ncbi:MAG: hypothetical protein S4CHLAM20_02870 [Chlamydiia bacterium]|nr:hypothetical protein [Chlamydiia bacterium]
MKRNLTNTLLMASTTCLSLFSGILSAVDPLDIDDYRSQLYSDVTPLEYGSDEEGKPTYLRVQKSTGNYLYLGPNYVFFNDPGVFLLSGETESEQIPDGRKREYAYITRFLKNDYGMEWGFYTTEEDDLHADVFIEGTSKDIGTTLVVNIDDEESKEFIINEEMLTDGYFQLDYSNIGAGFHKFKIVLKNHQRSGSFKIFNVRLSGEKINSSSAVQMRWRPKAAWSDWSSSKNPDDGRAWIMELSSDSKLGFFGPISTNFGYFGPVFKDGGKARSMNMSVWSSNKSSGPRELDKQSHLLGIGSSEGYFGTWSHEGRGVKVRGWDNFEPNTSGKYVIGLRFTQDEDFNTFYGYFWNEVTNKWQLYSIGRKRNVGPIDNIKTKSFIEVVGHTREERSNHVIREVQYRGWLCDSEGVWTDLDQVKIPRKKGVGNRRRIISEDGERFVVSTGGYTNYEINPNTYTLKKPETTKLPIYMRPKKLRDFYKVPFIPVVRNVSLGDDGQFTIKLRPNTNLSSTVKVCWGSENALSNAPNWEHEKEFTIESGKRRRVVTLKVPATEDARYFRVLVSNEKAQMWTFETYDLYPEEEVAEVPEEEVAEVPEEEVAEVPEEEVAEVPEEEVEMPDEDIDMPDDEVEVDE